MRSFSRTRTRLGALLLVLALPGALQAQQDMRTPSPEQKHPVITGAFFALSTGDLDRLVAWYRGNLGFTVDQMRTQPSGLKAALLSRPGALLEIAQLPSARARKAAGISDEIGAIHGVMKAGWLVADLDAVYALAKERRLDITFAPAQPVGNPLRAMVVKDPDGNTIQFFGK